jgi:tetratricopeptide (TPR) repeat protein
MRLVWIGLVLILAAPAGRAQTRDESATKCESNDPDAQIYGCTALIQSGSETAAKLSAAYYDRANAYNRKGLYDQSIADYTKVTTLNPDFAPAYNNRGFAYSKQGLYERAIADFTRLIALKPELASAYTLRGFAYTKEGLYDQAIADYTQAITLNPNFDRAYNRRAWAYHLKNEDARGLPDADKAVVLAPKEASHLAWISQT